jgi:apolipoprotein D and lipocalin family protein
MKQNLRTKKNHTINTLIMNTLISCGTFLISTHALCVSPALANGTPPTTVEKVESHRYLGLWHEQARIPNSFQDNTRRGGFGVCQNTTAEYGLLADSKISVTNTCYRKNGTGETKREIAQAIAYATDESFAHLKVNFTGIALLRWFGIGNGDYLVIGLGPINIDGLYSWALVGSPTRKYGWILSREENLDEDTLSEIYDAAIKLGYARESFVP